MARRTKTEQTTLADLLFPIRPEEDSGEILNIPPESRRLHTDTYDFTISTLFDLIERKKVRIPEFQRSYVWTRAQASRLIESLIIQCPIPVIYMDQTADGILYVIDGNQRLNSIRLYLQNAFALKGLRAYPELEGYRFAELDPRFQDHIRNRTLRCITILRDTHPQIKFDVFERLNTGAVQLNSQELRHGLSYGNLIKRIDSMVKADHHYLSAIGLKNDKRMKGSELILRFFALRYDLSNYKKPLASFLNNFASKNKDAQDSVLDEWERDFRDTAEVVHRIFGDLAFRLYNARREPSTSFNSALFDAQMVGTSLAGIRAGDISERRRNTILTKFDALLQDTSFKRAISASTSDELLVIGRITQFQQLFSS